MRKVIFGLTFDVQLSEMPVELGRTVCKILSAYPDALASEATDVELMVIDAKLMEKHLGQLVLGPTPRASFFERGIVWTFGSNRISFGYNIEKNLWKVILISSGRPGELPIWRKALSYEYPNRHDQLMQDLHELVLVPTAILLGRLPIHAAAISLNGGAYLVGGTGGVGKSSTLLKAAGNLGSEQVYFLSDDISILSRQGYVSPNLAWPKIYGYNFRFLGAAKSPLSSVGLLNKLHFYLKKWIQGESAVRRKMNPNEVFRIPGEDFPLRGYRILIRGTAESVSERSISFSEAAQLTFEIISGEYNDFFDFARQASFGIRLSSQYSEIEEIAFALEGFTADSYRTVFERVDLDCRLLTIPVLASRLDTSLELDSLLFTNYLSSISQIR